MSSFRDKLQVFFLGLMLGLLLGGGFFILKLDNYFRELSFYKSHDDSDDSKDGKKDEKQAQYNPQPVKKKNDGKTTSGTIGESASDSTLASNDADNASATDTLAADTSLTVMDRVVPGDDEIVVKKDELLASRTLELINLDLTANAGKKDSIAGSEPKISYKIEYWKSPINYKGYKMTRNKLVLYGISSADPVSLYRLDDDIYLKHLTAIYRLVFTNDFRQFEKVSDPSVLSKLSK